MYLNGGHYILPFVFDDVTKWTLKELLLNLFGIPFIKKTLYDPLWFVRELFVSFLLYPLIVLCVKRLPSAILIIGFICIIAGKIPFLYDNGYFLKSSIPFFSLGLWTGFNPKPVHIKIKGVIIAALAAIALVYINDGSSIFSSALSYAAILFFFPAIFSFAKYAERTKELSEMFLLVSKHSFMIFVLHGKLLTILQNVCVRIIKQSDVILYAEYIVLPIITIAVVLIISSCCDKKMPKLYRFFTGGR
ncbi:MAG: acyltransferase family protein [Butyrivibrio sp.]|nr:acyltransferase family protein [Butyrivibrio sp.]